MDTYFICWLGENWLGSSCSSTHRARDPRLKVLLRIPGGGAISCILILCRPGDSPQLFGA